jgi:hypothetical protein
MTIPDEDVRRKLETMAKASFQPRIVSAMPKGIAPLTEKSGAFTI